MSNYLSFVFTLGMLLSSAIMIGCQHTGAYNQTTSTTSTAITYNQWQWNTYHQHPDVVEALTKLPSPTIQTKYDEMIIEDMKQAQRLIATTPEFLSMPESPSAPK